LGPFQREVELCISEAQVEDFISFRQEMHQKIRNNYTGNYQKLFLQEQKNSIRLPGRVEAILYQKDNLEDDYFRKIVVSNKFENKIDYKPSINKIKNLKDFSSKVSKSVIQDN
jgi:hypothetical protein